MSDLSEYYLEIAYIISIIMFMMGLRKLGHPETAKAGNLLAGIGMTLAIVATIFLKEHSILLLISGVLLKIPQ